MTSRTSGCECCQVRVDLVDSVRRAVLRRAMPQRLIVVVDRAPMSGERGDGDPASDVITCIHTVQADGEVDRLACLDGVIVHVDACTTSTRLACGLDLWDAQTEAALAVADRICVTGARLLTTSARTEVMQALCHVNRIGELVHPDPVTDPIGGLVDLHAWHRPPASPRATNRRPAASPTVRRAPSRASTIETVVLRRPDVLDADDADAWLDRVVAEAPSRLLRFQAALRVSTDEPRVCVGGSRSAMRSHPETDVEVGLHQSSPRASSSDGDASGSVVVIVGQHLDHAALADGFASIGTSR